LLIAAGLLKLYARIPFPLGEWWPAFLHNSGFAFCVSACEIILGLWLILGVHPQWARRAAVACFLAFLAVSLIKVSVGEDKCGCFGPLPVSPWMTLGLDGAAAAALLFTRPPDRGWHSSRWSAALRLGLALAGTATTLGAVIATTEDDR
jgi:hypothetical protein